MTASKNDKWDEVIEREWKEEIKPGRDAVRKIESSGTRNDAAQTSDNGEPRNLVGLAFSGGGIRSATFNLGVIQALAELRLLRKIDYLSTVSGGGYIGSWLTSWMASHEQTSPGQTIPQSTSARMSISGFISRLWTSRSVKDVEPRNIADIEQALAPPDNNNKPVLAAGTNEPSALRHLRNYTNYLKPRGGVFSLDAMTAFATWLRNSLLNQLILLVIFSAALLLPLVVANFTKNCVYLPNTNEIIPFEKNGWLWLWASIFLAIAIGFINANILYQPTIENPKLPWYSSQNAVLLLIIFPLIVCSFLIAAMLPLLNQLVVEACGIVNFIQSQIGSPSWSMTPTNMVWWTFFLCGVSFLAGSPLRLALFKETNRRNSSVLIYGLVFIIAAISGLLLLPVIAVFLLSRIPTDFSAAVIANILTFGPPLILLAFALAVFVYVGLLGRVFDEHQREWWSRLVALIFFAAIGWLVLFGISIWSSLGVDYLKAGLTSIIAWLVTSGIGAALGKSASITTVHESKGANKLLVMTAYIAPYFFIFGLCLLVTHLLNTSLIYFLGVVDLSSIEFYNDQMIFEIAYYIRLAQFEAVFGMPHRELLGASLGLFAIGALLSWRIDINVFSFHNFYRNRLTRAYLAASLSKDERDRRKLPLTGMNDMDSPRLDRLPSRPYHLLNTALNITSGKHLSWQERKAASFSFSKRYCGYFLPGETRENNYCRTEDFIGKKGWLSLSLPMTISGAAASPNGGYHTSPPLAFLMTVFNLRLGWWMQNPTEEKYWQSKGPKFGLRYLFKELASSVDEDSPFVYLSDGGHFENLGIYELVRRKCRLVVACDASADPEFQFDDLGNAIRKCYIDLGVTIKIDTSKIKPRPESPHKGRSPQHSAIGVIHYPDSDETGVLLYIKASMGDEEATDIEHYKAAHPEFPHDPTSNQFYTESQFESYRKLGYTLCHRAFCDVRNSTTDPFLRSF